MRYSKKKYSKSARSNKKYSKKINKLSRNRNNTRKNKVKNYTSKKKYLSRKKRGSKLRKQKAKSVKNNNNKNINSQKGGNPISGIMSMLPFGFGGSDEPQGMSEVDFEQQEYEQNQKVMVDALCNQYMKNNIKGGNNTQYDPMLDNLCVDTKISIAPRVKSRSKPSIRVNRTTNSLNSNSSLNLNSNKNNAQNNNNDESQSGGMKIPSFLDGVKGLAKIYSMPMRAGYNAVNSGINLLKSKSKKNSENNQSSPPSSSQQQVTYSQAKNEEKTDFTQQEKKNRFKTRKKRIKK